jgi:hypothetical protein
MAGRPYRGFERPSLASTCAQRPSEHIFFLDLIPTAFARKEAHVRLRLGVIVSTGNPLAVNFFFEKAELDAGVEPRATTCPSPVMRRALVSTIVFSPPGKRRKPHFPLPCMEELPKEGMIEMRENQNGWRGSCGAALVHSRGSRPGPNSLRLRTPEETGSCVSPFNWKSSMAKAGFPLFATTMPTDSVTVTRCIPMGARTRQGFS